jgi:hypothetical protein
MIVPVPEAIAPTAPWMVLAPTVNVSSDSVSRSWSEPTRTCMDVLPATNVISLLLAAGSQLAPESIEYSKAVLS